MESLFIFFNISYETRIIEAEIKSILAARVGSRPKA